jgi:hypothetical protein
MMETIYDTHDYGYDPSVVEEAPLFRPPRTKEMGPITVNPQFLPPIGRQTTPSCFVWSSTYGLATFMAAQASGTSPVQPAAQASPTYTYIQVLKGEGLDNNCIGGKITSCFTFLKANGGTPSLATAPNKDGCAASWSAYQNGGLAPDAAFAPPTWYKIQVTGADGIDNVRGMIAQNVPLAYGTSLYTDFPTYAGSPVPYVGNDTILYKPGTTQPVGHCMMIIGYDDAAGAVLIQNSFGKHWGGQWNGSGGFVWMAYMTFQTLAQGDAFFIGGTGDPLRLR